MTVLQTAQVVAEVLRLPTAPGLRTAGVCVEVLRTNGTESSIFISLAERLASMEIGFQGQPFIAYEASTLNTKLLNLAFQGQPFVATNATDVGSGSSLLNNSLMLTGYGV